MLTPPLQDDFQYIVEKFGEPETLTELDASRIDAFQGRIPPALLTLWQHYGLCQFWGGLLRLCDPDSMRSVLSLAVDGDADLDAEQCHVVAYSAFGELFIWSERFQRLFLDLPTLQLRARVLEDESRRIADEDRAVAFLFAGDKGDFDRLDQTGKPLFARCRSSHGALEADECYGFFPALLLGGEADVTNVRRVKATEHFAILAQLDRPTLVRITPNGQPEPVRQIGPSRAR